MNGIIDRIRLTPLLLVVLALGNYQSGADADTTVTIPNSVSDDMRLIPHNINEFGILSFIF